MKTLTLTFRTDYPEALYDFFKKRETESKIGYDGLCKDFKIGTDTPTVTQAENIKAEIAAFAQEIESVVISGRKSYSHSRIVEKLRQLSAV